VELLRLDLAPALAVAPALGEQQQAAPGRLRAPPQPRCRAPADDRPRPPG
jgi:hypothetical protein